MSCIMSRGGKVLGEEVVRWSGACWIDGLCIGAWSMSVQQSYRDELTCQAFAQRIQIALTKFPEERRSDVVLLFSAHSLPLEIVK